MFTKTLFKQIHLVYPPKQEAQKQNWLHHHVQNPPQHSLFTLNSTLFISHF